MHTVVQTGLAFDYLLPGQVIRVNGGTVSQQTGPDEWNERTISIWADLLRSLDLKMSWTVNINRPIKETEEIIKRWRDNGINPAYIEVGNETYLPKYGSGMVGSPGVEHPISPSQYFDNLLPEVAYMASRLGLNNVFPIAAPVRAKIAQEWNGMLGYVFEGPLAPWLGGVSLHLYAETAKLSDYPYHQIEGVRLVAKNSPVYIGEAGVLPRTTPGEQVQHLQNIYGRLADKDILLAHTLVGAGENIDLACLNEYGETPMGEAVQAFFRKL